MTIMVDILRGNPDNVPEELFGQALHWLFTGIEASGPRAPAGRPEPPV